MIRSFNVEVHSNGITIVPLGLGEGQSSKVFQKDKMEEALLEMYHLCFDWNVGDRIKIERSKKED